MEEVCMFKHGFRSIIITLAIVCVAGAAHASSGYLSSFNTRYGTAATKLDTCNVCHTSVPSRNPYGAAYGSANHNFATIEGLDSDGDGSTNIVEIKALTFPGDATSKPAAPPPPPPPPAASAPVANAGPDQTVNEGVTVTLSGSNSTDPDNDIASYQWQRTAGPTVTISNSTSAKASFTAPDVSVGGASLTFQLTVKDSGGRTSTDTCVVNVTWVNAPPKANAGPDQTVDEGVTVTLDSSNSSDVDDGIASRSWIQTSGTKVTLSNPTAVQPTFIAPSVGTGTASLTFELTVTDKGGLKGTDTTVVNVTWLNIDPTANAGPDQTVDEGVTVTLDGSKSSDPDPGALTYRWTQTAGPSVTFSDPTSSQPTFTSPNVGLDGASLTFRLTVTDSGGAQATDSCIVNVTWVNAPPTANAGPDQAINEGTLVTLDGSRSSDPDDSIASYQWKQTGGTAVTLSDASAMQPTFMAPALTDVNGPLTFELTVTDQGGLQAVDTCTVTVTDVALPPAQPEPPSNEPAPPTEEPAPATPEPSPDPVTNPDPQPTTDLCPEQARYDAYLERAERYSKKAERLKRDGEYREWRKNSSRARVFESMASELEGYDCAVSGDDHEDGDRDRERDRDDRDRYVRDRYERDDD
jgi:hypothetical protein